MSHIADAVTALEYVKSRMPLDHSDNKSIRPELSKLGVEARQQKRQELKKTLDSMRTHHRFPSAGNATAKNVIYYGAFAIAAKHGNCLETSCATAWYLNEQGRFNYDMVYYPEGADHIFLVIGQHGDANGVFPADFGAWNEDAAICDVWADIACPARDYPARWRARMSNWRIMGILIANLLPTHDKWLNAVDQPKKSYLTPG